MAESCTAVLFTQLRVTAIFERNNFTRYCSDPFEVWLEI